MINIESDYTTFNEKASSRNLLYSLSSEFVTGVEIHQGSRFKMLIFLEQRTHLAREMMLFATWEGLLLYFSQVKLGHSPFWLNSNKAGNPYENVAIFW